jgi:hypothetical protein
VSLISQDGLISQPELLFTGFTVGPPDNFFLHNKMSAVLITRVVFVCVQTGEAADP